MKPKERAAVEDRIKASGLDSVSERELGGRAKLTTQALKGMDRTVTYRLLAGRAARKSGGLHVHEKEKVVQAVMAGTTSEDSAALAATHKAGEKTVKLLSDGQEKTLSTFLAEQHSVVLAGKFSKPEDAAAAMMQRFPSEKLGFTDEQNKVVYNIFLNAAKNAGPQDTDPHRHNGHVSAVLAKQRADEVVDQVYARDSSDPIRPVAVAQQTTISGAIAAAERAVRAKVSVFVRAGLQGAADRSAVDSGDKRKNRHESDLHPLDMSSSTGSAAAFSRMLPDAYSNYHGHDGRECMDELHAQVQSIRGMKPAHPQATAIQMLWDRLTKDRGRAS